MTILKFNSLYAFVAITVTSGLPWWLSTYQQYENHFWLTTGISTAIVNVAAIIIGRCTDRKSSLIFFFTALAHQLALLVKIVLDCLPDKTNHSLAPFEMIGVFLFDLAVIRLTLLISRSAAS